MSYLLPPQPAIEKPARFATADVAARPSNASSRWQRQLPGRELHPLKMHDFARRTRIVGMDEVSSAERWFEIWVDDGLEVPYVPIVLPLGNVSSEEQVIDPADG